MKAMILTVLGALALSAPAAAQGVTITAGVDVFLPAPGTTVVFTSSPNAVVVDSGVNGTVIVEQRTRFGGINTVRMNLRYPNHHRVRGVIVNDWVWTGGRRVLASKVFRHYYAPRTRVAAYRHAHAHVTGYRTGHGHRHARRPYDRHYDHRDGHTARRDRHGHHDRKMAKERRKHEQKMERERNKHERKMERERNKHEREMERERRKANKKAEKRNNGRGHGRDEAKGNNGRRGNGKGNRGNGNGNGRGRRNI